MAKLNGVTSVSERIQYNGAEYVKSDKAAVVGDIIRYDDESSFVTTGAFYEVVRIDSNDDPQIIDNDGDEFDFNSEEFAVFKRLEAAAAPTEDFVSHEGVQYRKVARKAAEGDLAITIDDSNCHCMGVGAVFTAGGSYSYGGIKTGVHARGKHVQVRHTDYAVLEPVTPAASQPQYREVKRKANVGERIRIVNAWLSLDQYKNGDEFTVKQTVGGNSGVQVAEAEIAIVTSEYVVLEPAEEPQPGDKVRSKMYPDTLHTLVKRLPQHDGDRYGKAWDITPGSWLGEKQFFIVERAAESVEPVEDPRLKVGEYAKVIGGNNYQTKIGDIVIIRSIDPNGDYRVNDLTGKQLNGHKKVNNVIRATDAEVAEAKRKAEETAEESKWAAIGRKVGEFKKGDIVTVKSADRYNGITGKVEDIGETLLGVREFSGSYRGPNSSDCELIAPVESLFTR